MLANVSLWYVLPVMFVIMLLACALGQAIGGRLYGTAGDGDDAGLLIGFVVSGVFGLLALLLGFSYSLAINRFEDRRSAVVEEANAIGTMYSRLDLLAETDRSRLQRDLAAYAMARTQWGLDKDERGLEAATARTEALYDAFGAHLFAVLRSAAPDPRIGPLVTAFNTMGDEATRRHAGRQARLPDGVVILLAVFLAGAALVLGFAMKRGTPAAWVMASLLLGLLAVAFSSILDLDRPSRGTFRVPQDEMIRLAARLAEQTGQPLRPAVAAPAPSALPPT